MDRERGWISGSVAGEPSISSCCRLPEEREHHSMVVSGDCAYVHGGERLFTKRGQCRLFDDTWRYNFKSGAWQQLPTSGVPMMPRYVDEGCARAVFGKGVTNSSSDCSQPDSQNCPGAFLSMHCGLCIAYAVCCSQSLFASRILDWGGPVDTALPLPPPPPWSSYFFEMRTLPLGFVLDVPHSSNINLRCSSTGVFIAGHPGRPHFFFEARILRSQNEGIVSAAILLEARRWRRRVH